MQKKPECSGKTKKICNKNGFSLIELVFAMSFMSLIIFGVINLQSSNLALVNRQINQLKAQSLADQQLKIAKAIGFGTIDTVCNTVYPCNIILNKNGAVYSASKGEQNPIDEIFLSTLILEKIPSLSGPLKLRSIIEWEDSTGSHLLDDNAHVESKSVIYN